MSNFFCIKSRVLRVKPAAAISRRNVSCLSYGLAQWILSNWGIPAQAGQWNLEKGQEKAPSAETFNAIAPAKSEKININIASVEELEALPGLVL